jgi:hypothetical protein
VYTTKQGYDMKTTKQAIQAIKKHKGAVIVNARIGELGLWVAVAKNELIRQIQHSYAPHVDDDHEWLEVEVDENGDLSVEYMNY